MKFQDIPVNILSIRVKRTDNAADPLQEQSVFSVDANLTKTGEFEIRLKDFVASVKPVVKADIYRLNAELAQGRAVLAQLVSPAVDGSIELQAAIFTGECLEIGEVEIGVDEYVETSFSGIERRKGRLQGNRLYRELDQRCCFRQADTAFFFLTAGPAIDSALEPEPVLEEKVREKPKDSNDAENSEVSKFDAEPDTHLSVATQMQKPEPTRKNSFCVTGDGIRFVATETALPEGKSIFAITRMTGSRNGPDRAVRLARGKLAFTDWTKAGRIQILAKAQMSALTTDDGSYLKKWDEFGDLEGELLLRRAREVGELQYFDMQQSRDGTVRLRIAHASESALKRLATGDVPEVELVDELPDYLKSENLTFRAFVGKIEKEEKDEKFNKESGQREKKRSFKVSDFDVESKTMTLADENLPMESGTFILSLAGEIAQIKRRMSARRAIVEGRAANPQLGLLIEEKGKIEPTRRPQKIEPLTAFVREKIFRNPPTVMQEKAIEVALNTPDIALVQGPPGTGKTTVIAAILERLNEIADKRGVSIKGHVLLTGFQHDAVENMIERLSLNGIPVPKFGRRSDAAEGDFSNFEKTLEDWCGKIAAELRARNPQIDEIEHETEIKNLCLQYVQAPTRGLAANLAERIASLGVSILGEDCARWAARLAKHLSDEEKFGDESERLLGAVRRLRIHSASFVDDGPERAADALDDLKYVLDEGERTLLNDASLWRREDGEMPSLKELAALKKKFLDRFTAQPVFRVEKHNDEVFALAREAVERIKTVGYSTKDAKSAALAEFLAELESNPYGMIDAVSDYSFAFAATCQQSVNRQMQVQKGVYGDDAAQKMEYEYVIVDEAARVSPRDLMVPMVQGKRIILVGDHRQLPHIIDDEVARQMEAGETGQEESNWLKKSMFHYLFSERLKTLEDGDGVVRRVTLDKQYRMHPLLGDFVSRNFYERFNPSEKFGSGRPTTDFTHDLPGTDNKPAIWLDVPIVKGMHKKHGTSWTRPAEATAIVHQLQMWMNSEVGQNLSFGVISFYKAQANLIKEQLGRQADDDKKLRIGTVDSFQGMEFDVVFLSMVRTLPKSQEPEDDDREIQARKLFGHLCLYNRLNVSMSRQKKVLIVAGDSDLLRGDLAAEFVPGLVDFLKLCQTEGMVFQCR
ncbi:DEAD/DEAH box helicase [Caballeronia sp. SBC2]|uniref:DEAD/DEAH box helicase n=1 Tax=Caballeronia sp. SBC2 TaxID=2705547 RepID=UPI0013E17C5B|nr:AAA domain-containing protein [Caballeronia sp. SBC2]QIE30194.1 RecBCD enzyme subunit RecD [Caballeronia sp. SBC2]